MTLTGKMVKWLRVASRKGEISETVLENVWLSSKHVHMAIERLHLVSRNSNYRILRNTGIFIDHIRIVLMKIDACQQASKLHLAHARFLFG
jgi:hypothetical protein